VRAIGEVDVPVFARSALKPFQALPLVESGAASAFGFGASELALCCGSHAGEAVHRAGVAAMLARIGCGADDLQCSLADRLGHNCSGKHAGFLAACRHAGWAIGSYLDPAHPLQAQVRAAIVRVAGSQELIAAVDGCSAPAYALPLTALARAYAALGAAEDGPLATLFGAMAAHPLLVSGSGKADEFFTRAGGGDVVAKGGADGVQAFAIRSLRLGVAIKIWDGDARAKHAVGAALLAALGVVAADREAEMRTWTHPPVVNARATQTGEGRVLLKF
jgi:L-asparaginase II